MVKPDNSIDYVEFRTSDMEATQRFYHERSAGASPITGRIMLPSQGRASVVRPIFSFPGGRRFHFLDPSGDGLAIRSE